jgi:glycosyltransferase involved in cell wall biosynthesis
MFTDSYLPRVSGVVHSLEALARGLRAKGHNVLIVAPAYRGYRDTDGDVLRFPSFRPLRGENFPLAVPFSRSARQRLEQIPLDLVHTHTPFVLGSVAAGEARRRRVPLVFTHHTLYEEYVHYAAWIPAVVSRRAVRAYVRRFVNRTACTIAPSHAVAAYLRGRGVTARIEVVPTGTIELSEFADLAPDWVRPAYGVPADRPLLVTASRLGKEKSVGLLLEAFARIPARYQATLLIVGGGPAIDDLQTLTGRLGLGRRTVFAGLQPHRRALECIAAGDIFLFASQTETQGLAVIEAMAAGVPVVAVDAGGVSDAVTDGVTGFLTGPSAAELADRTRLLLDDPPRRRQFGGAGRAAAQRFSLDQVTDVMIHVYDSVLAGGHGPCI